VTSAHVQQSRTPTLVHGMFAAAAAHPRAGFTFQDISGTETFHSFKQLLEETERSAAGLQALGLRKGDRVALLTQDPAEFVITFLGAVRAGIIPVPLYPPPPLGGFDAYVAQIRKMLAVAQPAALVGSERLEELDVHALGLPLATPIARIQELLSQAGPMRACDIDPDDVVFLQFTSGSTGTPRAVIVTHRALVANIDCFMEEALGADPQFDKGVSWLPLHHDMGLIGFVLGPVCRGVPVVLIPTLRFVKAPGVWLEAIHRHRATITFAPNFAFALALRRLRPAECARWDLSCLKALGCGAEPIRPDLIASFFAQLGPSTGLRASAFMPAYGLAESTLAVAIRRLSEPLRIERVDRDAFERDGHALPARPGHPALEHIGHGEAFRGHRIAIRSSQGTPMPSGQEGEIWIHGPSVCEGYVGDETTWRELCRDGWLNTGDRGYLSDNHLFVTGRSKDLIILNGRNVHPQSLEWSIGQIQGVRPQGVVAFAISGATTEEIVIALEARTTDSTTLVTAVEETVYDLVAARPAAVLVLSSGSLPRTTSGKLRRANVRQQYLDGGLRDLQLVADP